MTDPLAVRVEDGAFHFSLELRDTDPAYAAIEPLHRHMEDFMRGCGVPEDARHAILMAAEELITNTAKYGGEQRSCGGSVAVKGTEIVFEYFDDGILFDPTASPPLPDPDELLDRPVGGLGLGMMAARFDARGYRRVDGLNRSLWRLSFAKE